MYVLHVCCSQYKALMVIDMIGHNFYEVKCLLFLGGWVHLVFDEKLLFLIEQKTNKKKVKYLHELES